MPTNLTDFSFPIFIEWVFELKKYTQLEQIESTSTISPDFTQQVLRYYLLTGRHGLLPKRNDMLDYLKYKLMTQGICH